MSRIFLRLLVLVLLCLPGACSDRPGRPAANVGSVVGEPVVVPFSLDHNRMIVEVEFVRVDGGLRRARAWVDTGHQHLGLGRALATELGVEPGEAGGERSPLVQEPVPTMLLDGMPLCLDGVAMQVSPADHINGLDVEVHLPASILRHYHVVFDYPAEQLVVATPGVLEPEGVAVPCRVNPETGLPMVDAVVDGDEVPLGIDMGSAGTWVSTRLTTQWLERHPEWPEARGAAGSTNFFGFPFEAEGVLMRLPELEVGAVQAQDVALLGLDQSLFDWYSEKSAGPVLGFIGANVLRGFRLEIDFPNQVSYWQPGTALDDHDLEIVGLSLRLGWNGGFTVAGVVSRDGTLLVDGVLPGDVLVAVDDLEAAGTPMGTVVDALRGAPGTMRTLLLERDGERFTVEAPVVKLP